MHAIASSFVNTGLPVATPLLAAIPLNAAGFVNFGSSCTVWAKSNCFGGDTLDGGLGVNQPLLRHVRRNLDGG